MIHNMRELLDVVGVPTFEKLRKTVYKYTDCGAWIVREDCRVIVGSTVEGADAEVQPIRLDYPFSPQQYWEALEALESEADLIWKSTHGCDTCAKILGYGSDELCPVASDCPECKGEGV